MGNKMANNERYPRHKASLRCKQRRYRDTAIGLSGRSVIRGKNIQWMDGNLYNNTQYREKGLDLDSPFNFARTETAGAYLHSSGFITAKINFD